jgi:NADH-quinone oxidoreductase subunit A
LFPDGYITDWLAIALAIAVGLIIIGGMFAVSALLSPRRPSISKALPYESGIIPGPLRLTQLSVRYYVFAILFLIFDVEAVFLFPWALVFLEGPSFVFYAMMLFMAILFLGVVYAWRKGALEWR